MKESLLRISDAASLGMHAMAWMAGNPDKTVSVRSLSEALQVSANHLSKVFQRLEKQGLLTAERGPKGGFRIAGKPEDITLLMIYEAIEGPFNGRVCLLEHPVCLGEKCLFSSWVADLPARLRQDMEGKRLSDLATLYTHHGG